MKKMSRSTKELCGKEEKEVGIKKQLQ